MTNPSCPHAAEILEAATDPERRPLRSDAVAHLEACATCRDLGADVALVELLTRAPRHEFPAALESLPRRLVSGLEARGSFLRGRGSRRIAAAAAIVLAFLLGRWSSRQEISPEAPSPPRTLVVHMESPRTSGLFTRRELVIEPSRSPGGFLAALKPK